MDHLVAPFERPGQESPQNRRTQAVDERSAWQLALHAILVRRLIGVNSLKPVRVLPECERSLDQFIAELFVLNESKVTRGPAHPDRSYANGDRHPATIPQSANLLLDSNPFPQREKTEDRIRALMPLEDPRGGRGKN